MQASVRITDRLIVQTGTSIGARTDCDIVEFTADQEATFLALRALPNGGIEVNIVGVLTARPAPAPVPDALLPYVQRCRDYIVSAQPGDTADLLDQYLAAAIPTAVQTVAVTKETIRTLRALIRVVRGMST